MSIMRISGLASGMDIEQIISDLMYSRRVPLDKISQDKQRLEWQQEDFRTLNKQLNSFRETVFNLKLERTFNVKLATSSNENVVEVSASGNAVVGTYSIAVTQLAEGAFKTSSEALGSGEDLSTLNSQFGLSGEIAFSINGKEMTIDADSDSIYDLIGKINNAGVGVQASYDSTLDRVFLSTTATGADAKIEILDGADGSGTRLFMDRLKIDTDVAEGKDALFNLNGANFAMSSNEFTISGISYSLKGTSPMDSGGNPVKTTVTVKSDTEQIFQSVMEFVRVYNETIDKINGKLHEEYYRDYPPLTDEMREQLDEDQIEKWTEKARSGLLKNDTMLTGIITEMRSGIYSIVEGVSGNYNSLAGIGITTKTYTFRGKLEVNEEDLRKAIATDPEAVKKLFTTTSEDGNERNEGIASRLYKSVINGISKITERAGTEADFSLVDNSVIGKRIRNMSERIEDYEDRLKIIEERYWRQFTAMEEAISLMNSQSMWLTQQFFTGQQR